MTSLQNSEALFGKKNRERWCLISFHFSFFLGCALDILKEHFMVIIITSVNKLPSLFSSFFRDTQEMSTAEMKLTKLNTKKAIFINQNEQLLSIVD